MFHFNVSKLLTVTAISIIVLYAFHPGWLMVTSFAEQFAGVQVIEVKEVKEEGKESLKKISLSEVEKARDLTAERIYWLAGLWVLILLAIFLIRIQLRDDERLYQEGYYSKDLE